MNLLKQSTAVTVIVGPVLATDGTAYTGMVIGDFNITKNGTTVAMAAAATATHSHNGYYLIGLTTGNTDTLGELAISANKATYAMSLFRYEVVPAAVYDSLVAGSANLPTDLQTIKQRAIVDPGATVTVPTSLASPTNITAGVISTVTNLTNLPAAPTDWLTAAAVKADAVTKIQVGLSTYAGADTAGTGTLLTRLTATRAGYLDNLASAPLTTLGATAPVGWINAAAVAAAALDGKGDWNVGKTGYSLTQAFPANFSTMGINASGHVSRVTLVDTNTDMRGTDGAYTGTPPTASAISLQVEADLITAHGAGSWTTANVSGLLTTVDFNASNAVVGGTRLLTMIALDGAVYHFTANALELAPTGGGGTGLSGPSTVTLTFRDAGGAPVPLVDFTVVGVGPGRSDVSGVAVFGINDGTYTVVANATSAVLFAPATLVVSGATAQDITGSANIIPPASDSGTCNCAGTTRDKSKSIVSGIVVTFRPISYTAEDGQIMPNKSAGDFTVTSSGTAENNLQVILPRGATYQYWVGVTNPGGSNSSKQFTVTDTASMLIPGMT
jgi:hypothetical protein